MAATTETQRLISVSLGKIAQSRGQRGGINLHKNLLVATVLHKARTAYMMESYSYKQKQEQFLIQQQQQQQQLHAVQHASNVSNGPANCVSDKGDVCQQAAPRDSNLGQPTATPLPSEETRSEICAATGSDEAAHEPMALQESDPEVVFDKENSPPGVDDRLVTQDSTLSSERSGSPGLSQPDHLFAATQLSLDAQLASDKQQSSGNTTCSTNNVLKRRRDNPSASSSDYECPVSKKARVAHESPYSSYTSSYSEFSSDISDCSSDESDSESEPEAMYTSETPQINNLVTIFNSGFSGLCAVTNQADLNSSSGCQSDLDMSNSSSPAQFSNRNKLRAESPSPAYSRKMSEPSLLCSTQVGRLESLPSAIVLSA